MKGVRLLHYYGMLLFFAVVFSGPPVSAEPLSKIDSGERCPVCGMFVAKYPNWVTQIRDQSGKMRLFDGVKDMMAFYFAPASFGADAKTNMGEIWVKEYYGLEWLDGRKAFYVVGSDVYGPMGEEFIPFLDRAAAESFLKDHHGSQVVAFTEITAEMVESMRSQHKMKGQMMK